MKRFFVFQRFAAILVALAATQVMSAQEPADSVRLDEVMVEGSRVVKKTDRQVFYPSDVQKKASSSGYGLLGQLALPHIRVDEFAHSITALTNVGGVQVRINDVEATAADLLALDVKAVSSVEFIDRPGVRYGDDIAYVINIVVQKSVGGYALGTNLTNCLTSLHGDENLYARANYKKSELGASYSFNYGRDAGSHYDEQSSYQLLDGSLLNTHRQTLNDVDRSLGHSLQLSYSVSDSSYVLQTRLNARQLLGPNRHMATWQFTRDNDVSTYNNVGTSTQKSPSLDLYFHCNLARHQSLTANVVGTCISAHTTTQQNEGGAYAYDTDARNYSLWSQAEYENRLRPFTIETGVQFSQQYLSNTYTGDTEAHNHLRSSTLYVFGQLRGQWRTVSYMGGLGISRRYFSTGAGNRYDFVLLRPQCSLSLPIGTRLKASYTAELNQHVSKIALVNQVTIKSNAMEMLVGNPEIQPNSTISHNLTLSWQTPRLSIDLQAYYRRNPHCNMEKTIRTTDEQNSTLFVNTQTNQRGVHFFFLQPMVRCTILPDILTATAYCGVWRFFNYGDDYTHTYTACNAAAWLQAYLGRWSLTAYADNGYHWMEGEKCGHQGALTQLQASCRLTPRLTLAMALSQPFCQHPQTMRTEVMNRYVGKQIVQTDRADGNRLRLTLTFSLSRGPKYPGHERTLSHEDTDTGIL